MPHASQSRDLPRFLEIHAVNLQDRSAIERAAALQRLFDYGGGLAKPFIERSMADSSAFVRFCARDLFHALEGIEASGFTHPPAEPPRLPRLPESIASGVEDTYNFHPKVRIQGLKTLRPRRRTALERVASLAFDGTQAAELEQALPHVVAATRDRNLHVRLEAEKTLHAIIAAVSIANNLAAPGKLVYWHGDSDAFHVGRLINPDAKTRMKSLNAIIAKAKTKAADGTKYAYIIPLLYASLDADAEIRVKAVRALGDMRHPALATHLLSMVQNDSGRLVRTEALDALGRIPVTRPERIAKELEQTAASEQDAGIRRFMLLRARSLRHR